MTNPEEHLILSAHYNKEDNGMAQCSPEVRIVTQNVHHKLNHMVRSTDQFNSQASKHKSYTIIPNIQSSFHRAEKPPYPSRPEESSPNNLHPEKSFV